MVVEYGSGGDVPVEDVVSNVIESLFSCFVFVHVEGVVDFSRVDSFSPGLDRVDWRS